MYIYKKDNDKILVYKVTRDSEKESQYKWDNIKLIHGDTILYKINISPRDIVSQCGEELVSNIAMYKTSPELSIYKKVKFFPEQLSDKTMDIIRNYCDGNISSFYYTPIRVNNNEYPELHYILVHVSGEREQVDYNVINIPKKLYSLEMLKRGRYETLDQLSNNELKDLMSIYSNLDFIGDFDYESFNNLKALQVIDENNSVNFNRKLRQSSRILSLIKKYHGI